MARRYQPKTGFAKSSDLAIIDVRRRRAAAISTIGSATETWLHTISTAPVAGSWPLARQRIRRGGRYSSGSTSARETIQTMRSVTGAPRPATAPRRPGY